jgi:hypothetical protein
MSDVGMTMQINGRPVYPYPDKADEMRAGEAFCFWEFCDSHGRSGLFLRLQGRTWQPVTWDDPEV